MNPGRFSSLMLGGVILVLIGGVSLILFFQLRSDKLSISTGESGVATIHFMFHDQEGLRGSTLLIYGVEKGRLSLLSIPGNVGMVLPQVERIDSIDTLFDAQDPRVYLSSIERLLEISIPFYISIATPDNLVRLVDLLGGIQTEGEGQKDGLQVLQELESAQIRYADLVESLFFALQKDIPFFTHESVLKELEKLLMTNIDRNSLHTLIQYTAALDVQQVFHRKVEGNVRNVIANEVSKNLLFPFFDGDWTREYVSQLQQLLVRDEEVDTEAIRIRVLNGTDTVGLARRTANLLQGFGFTVVEIGNAGEADYQRSLVINHRNGREASERVAQVIQTNDIRDEISDEGFDITLILGRDFDGRYVRDIQE